MTLGFALLLMAVWFLTFLVVGLFFGLYARALKRRERRRRVKEFRRASYTWDGNDR